VSETCGKSRFESETARVCFETDLPQPSDRAEVAIGLFERGPVGATVIIDARVVSTN
jgi:hypothetical protein